MFLLFEDLFLKSDLISVITEQTDLNELNNLLEYNSFDSVFMIDIIYK